MIDVLDLAAYCAYKQPMSNLKLQKVLYFIQAEFLVSTGKPCFSEEIVARDFGPVVESVYYHYRMNVGTTIYEKHINLNCSKEEQDLIDNMLEELKDYSNLYLMEIIHNQKPWKDARKKRVYVVKNGSLSYKYVITNESLLNYFKD